MKFRAKNLGLGALILGVTSTLPSCLGLIGAAVIADHHARIVARGNGNSSNDSVYSPRVEPFTCSYMKDFDGDGCIDPITEAVDRGKVVFYVGDKLTYAVYQRGNMGKTLKLFTQSTPDSEIRERISSVIQKDHSTPQTPVITLNTPGIFHAYWTLDGVKIGEYLIQVKER